MQLDKSLTTSIITDDSSTAVAAAAPEQYNQGTSFEVAHSSPQMQHS
jgi:hypothetical protein